MALSRSLFCLVAALMVLASFGCSPTDPRSRIMAAMDVLQSDVGGTRKAKACVEVRMALTEYPTDAADRVELTERTVRLLIRALADPLSRVAAQDALVGIGIRSYEPLFDAVLATDAATQAAAVTCLIRMSYTAVPALIPGLMSGDFAAQDRATRILARIGKPISGTLRMYHAKVLEPFANRTASDASTALTNRGTAALLAFARVFGEIGDETSMLALMDGCETLRHAYPDVGAAHLGIIDGLGPDALKSLSRADLLKYDRLKLMTGLATENAGGMSGAER